MHTPYCSYEDEEVSTSAHLRSPENENKRRRRCRRRWSFELRALIRQFQQINHMAVNVRGMTRQSILSTVGSQYNFPLAARVSWFNSQETRFQLHGSGGAETSSDKWKKEKEKNKTKKKNNNNNCWNAFYGLDFTRLMFVLKVMRSLSPPRGHLD